MYPLVRELAADGIPVAVTCRVLKIARQPYYRWLANPVTDGEWQQAHLADALFDAHRDDPEFGYRFLADEARSEGHVFADRTAWKICSANGWFSVFGKKKGRKTTKPGHLPMTTWSAASSARPRRTSCGSPTSPNTGPTRASCMPARSRTCSPTGSSAMPSTHG